jgi:hypothetical protein
MKGPDDGARVLVERPYANAIRVQLSLRNVKHGSWTLQPSPREAGGREVGAIVRQPDS